MNQLSYSFGYQKGLTVSQAASLLTMLCFLFLYEVVCFAWPLFPMALLPGCRCEHRQSGHTLAVLTGTCLPSFGSIDLLVKFLSWKAMLSLAGGYILDHWLS